MVELTRSIRILGATGQLRTGDFHGQDHLVVPIVALVEGVLWPSNSASPELVLASEFSKSPAGWNGRPVVLDHPDSNGQKISANSPQVLESRSIGTVFNTEVKDQKLTMEAWINPLRADTVGLDAVRLLERVKNEEPVEISVGAFVGFEVLEGMHKGKPYKSVWRNIIPDHLAFLPEGTTGACSIEMGCGTIRAASAYVLTDQGFIPVYESSQTTPITENDMDETKKKSLMERFLSVFKEFELTPAEETKATEETLVLEMLKQPTTSCGCTKGDTDMEKAQRIAALVAKGTITVEDSKILEAASEDVMKALEVQAAVVPNPGTSSPGTSSPAPSTPAPSAPSAPPPTTTTSSTPSALASKPLTLDEYIGQAPAAFQSSLRAMARQAEANKIATITALKATGRCKFTDLQMNEMEQETLDQLSELAAVPAPVVYEGRQFPTTASVKETVSAPPSLTNAIRAAAGKSVN